MLVLVVCLCQMGGGGDGVFIYRSHIIMSHCRIEKRIIIAGPGLVLTLCFCYMGGGSYKARLKSVLVSVLNIVKRWGC